MCFHHQDRFIVGEANERSDQQASGHRGDDDDNEDTGQLSFAGRQSRRRGGDVRIGRRHGRPPNLRLAVWVARCCASIVDAADGCIVHKSCASASGKSDTLYWPISAADLRHRFISSKACFSVDEPLSARFPDSRRLHRSIVYRRQDARVNHVHPEYKRGVKRQQPLFPEDPARSTRPARQYAYAKPCLTRYRHARLNSSGNGPSAPAPGPLP